MRKRSLEPTERDLLPMGASSFLRIHLELARRRCLLRRETGVPERVRVKNLLLAVTIALTVSCRPAPPDQATASARARQDIDFEETRREMVEEQIEARGVTDLSLIHI